jgi:CheY-like chemotaxis protein
MRILFVDDTPDVLTVTGALLGRTFPSAEIETATTIREARERIDRTVRRGGRYDVAILDLELPLDQGQPPKFDYELCVHTRRVFPDVVVIHYSGYVGRKEVQEHVRVVGYDKIIDKVNDGNQGLIDAIRDGYGDKLLKRTEALLGGQVSGVGLIVQRGPARCGTPDVNALVREISRNFGALDQEDQARIRQYVTIERADSGFRVVVGRRAQEGDSPK